MKTDTQLCRDVTTELTWVPTINPDEIRVHVTDGVVTLVGQVACTADKWAVVRAAQRVTCVTAVAVALDIGSATAATPEVYFKLGSGRGWVTLSGEMDWVFPQRAATASRSDIDDRSLSESSLSRDRESKQVAPV